MADDEAYEPVDFPGLPPTPTNKPTKPTPTNKPTKLQKPQYEHIPGSPKHFPQPNPPTPPPRGPRSRLQTMPASNSHNTNTPPIPTSPRPKIKGFSSITPPSSPTFPRKPVKCSGSMNEGFHHKITSPSELIHSTPAEEEEPLQLGVFLAKYSSSLPLRVRVDKGFCGAEERFVISAGDVYNIHFSRKTKVVAVKDSNGYHYTIPLNSAIEFGLLYNPNQKEDEALKGFTFETVADIMAAKLLPKIVCATKAYRANDPKLSVENNEVLIVKKIVKTIVKRQSTLKVFSLTKHKEKILHEDCAGQFVTDPFCVRLYLPEILEHVPNPFPTETLLYANAEAVDQLPVHLISQVVTLTHSSVEASLIATTYWEKGTTHITDEDKIPVDIPVSIDIEVTILPIEDESQQLYSDTRNLYEGFDPTKVITWKDTASGSEFETQAQIYRAVRQGHEKDGLELQRPNVIYECPDELVTKGKEEVDSSSTRRDLKPENKSANAASKEVEPEHPKPVIPHRKSSTPTSPSSPPPTARKPPPKALKPSHLSTGVTKPGASGNASKQIAELQASAKSLQSLFKALQENTGEQFKDIKAELACIAPVTEDLSRQYDSTQEELRKLKQQVANLQRQIQSRPPQQQRQERDQKVPTKPAVGVSSDEHNIAELRTLDHMKVIQLLEAMNLKQYQERFMQEHVDGELLAECDDNILENDLAVSSKLHRNRLMKLVTGKHSAVAILEGEDPYVTLVTS